MLGEGTWRAGSGRGLTGPPEPVEVLSAGPGLAQPTRAHTAPGPRAGPSTRPRPLRAEVAQHRQEAQPPELCCLFFKWVPPNREIQLHEA